MGNLNMIIENNTKLKTKSLKIIYYIKMYMGFIISFNFLLCQAQANISKFQAGSIGIFKQPEKVSEKDFDVSSSMKF